MNDHLDRETSVSIDLTTTGVKAKAKSRFVAAVDRLGGNIFELMNGPLERKILRDRAVAAGEVELIRSVTNYGVEKLKHDPDFAERSAERYYKRIFEKQTNKDGVLLEALEDLRHEPASENESETGGDEIDDQVLSRIESFAEEASTEALRQKWGRVLSTEVKKPGTFSIKVLRIVDEISPDTAALFERLCESHIGDAAPKCLSGILPFGEITKLVTSGLVLDPGITGHIKHYKEVSSNSGAKIWVLYGPDVAVSIPVDSRIPNFMGDSSDKSAVMMVEKSPVMPVYLFTDAGISISSMFSAKRKPNFARYVEEVRKALPEVNVVEYIRGPDGNSLVKASSG